MRAPGRWLAAAVAGWVAAAVLYATAGHVSLVLLLGPIAFVLGDMAAERRKASDEAPGFAGRTAVTLRRRSRLLGLPPRLIDLRIVRGADGVHWAVRAEARGPSLDDIRWRVTRLTEAEAHGALG